MAIAVKLMLYSHEMIEHCIISPKYFDLLPPCYSVDMRWSKDDEPPCLFPCVLHHGHAFTDTFIFIMWPCTQKNPNLAQLKCKHSPNRRYPPKYPNIYYVKYISPPVSTLAQPSGFKDVPLPKSLQYSLKRLKLPF